MQVSTHKYEKSELNWSNLVQQLISKKELSSSQAYSAMAALLGDEVSPVIAAAFLVALRAKGESVQEMVGMANAMIEFGLHVDYEGELLDTCGTGGDQKHTVNVSTMAALVCAGAGVKVAKHGNRAASSKAGSADVLENLGVKIDLGPKGVAQCIRRTNMGFCMAPVFHKAMAHVVPIRRALGIPTAFNFLGPLVNPAMAKYQIVGVFDPSMLMTMAKVLGELGSNHALVIHAKDGYDELSITSQNTVIELKRDDRGEVVFDEYILDPGDYGFAACDPSALEGGDAVTNAKALLSVLLGEKGPIRDIVLLNSGAALYVSGASVSISAGIELATQVIDSGAAKRTLDLLVEVSNSCDLN